MKWLTLFSRIGKQPIRITRQQDVCVVDFDGRKEKLALKFDAHGCPYFAFENQVKFLRQ